MVVPSKGEAQIPRFYAGRAVFITGGSGFMGKVLIERLLSTCPDISKLYILLREKKDVLPEKRLEQLKQSQVFDVVREKCPRQLDKLAVVRGDTTLPNLGIDPHQVDMLKEVSVVFHSAATLKFNEELKMAVNQNIRSVLSLLDICDTFPNLDAFIHVSTAYSNSELREVEERVYPIDMQVQQLLHIVDSVPPHLLQEITPKIVSCKPNTYTFTKALAEKAVEEHGCQRYPVAIFRPSIVISAVKHPYPGWVENLNGPCGTVVTGGKGLQHAFQARAHAKTDLLPVDIAIDTLIAVAWEIAVDRPTSVRVYHCCTTDNPTTWDEFYAAMRVNLRAHPLDSAVYYPTGILVANKYAFNFLEHVMNTMWLHFLEYTTRFLGLKSKINLIMVSDKLRAMNEVLRYFAVNEWHFHTGRMRALRERLSPADAQIYNLDTKTIDWPVHYENLVKGTRKFILKEKDTDMSKARQHMKKLYYIHTAVQFIAFIVFLRVILQNNSYIRNFIYGVVGFLLSLSKRVTASVIA